jgi:hypothetical protein
MPVVRPGTPADLDDVVGDPFDPREEIGLQRARPVGAGQEGEVGCVHDVIGA